MGYRVAVLDPDPDCPAAAVADLVVIGSYEDVEAALRLADASDVVTYELEHVAAEVVAALETRLPVRPGRRPLLVTQDRIAERRFVESAGVAVARVARGPLRWRGTRRGRRARPADPAQADDRWVMTAAARSGSWRPRSSMTSGRDSARPSGTALLAEREIDFEAELSVIVARATDGSVAVFPIARNVHDEGILVESVAPAPVAHGGGGRRGRDRDHAWPRRWTCAGR